jgi:NAD(P)-dependent dehydrogenase (short-subunit alcohol dehydrogenase family)
MKLEGKVAIITGAGSGIGRASAIAFAREGAAVVVADKHAAVGKETADAICAEGFIAAGISVDVASEASVEALIAECVTRFGRIDILFNNAGVVLVKPLEMMSEEEWDRVMAINVKGAFLAIKHAVPHLRKAGGGVILNTGSIGSFTGQLGTPAYSASKGAIALLTKALALDYGRDNIRVNCICPGITDTPMLREHMGHGAEGEAAIRNRLARVPTGQVLTHSGRDCPSCAVSRL